MASRWTAYRLADATDQLLFPSKELVYRSAIAIQTIRHRGQHGATHTAATAAEAERVRKWPGGAEKLGASHKRLFGGDIPTRAGEDQAVVWAVEIDLDVL